MCKRCKKLIALALALVMTLAMATPVLAAEQYNSSWIAQWKDYLYKNTTSTLYKVPTDLAPTPLPEDLNLDPLAYWEQIDPWSPCDDAGVEKTTRPTQEVYQEIRHLVNELTAGLPTDSDKFAALSMWVNSNIKYSLDIRTDNVYLVFERRYGACTERANMLYFMATMAGIKAIILNDNEHQSAGALDENGVWFGDAHSTASTRPVAKYAYYVDGMDQYYCNLETGEIEKTRTFVGKEPDRPVSDFTDVPKGAWFAEAVDWAVAKGITEGAEGNTFRPYDLCTHDQILTYLYRAAGKPDPGNTKLPFTPKNNWATDALKWANGARVRAGFDENAPCPRAVAVDYIWWALGEPRLKTGHGYVFADTDGRPYNTYAISWAVEQGIAGGTGGNNFSPDLACNRATIVTMLYRAFRD